jgi:hypothetical protein
MALCRLVSDPRTDGHSVEFVPLAVCYNQANALGATTPEVFGGMHALRDHRALYRCKG